MSSRLIALATTAVVVVFLFLGCGDSDPKLDPATQYSPQSLAQEIAFRCKTLNRSAPRVDEVVKSSTGAATKKGAATKEARTDTIDGLIAETIQKASKIPGMGLDQACKKVAEEVSKNSEISDDDKKAITEALKKYSD